MQNLSKADKAAARKAAAAKAAATRAANKAAAEKAAAEQPATDARADNAATRRERIIARDTKTVLAGRTNFGTYSSRDDSYTAFFGAICRDTGRDTITLADILAYSVKRDGQAERNPFYTGSSKATDAGAINRQCSDGRFTKATDARGKLTLTVTERGKTLAAFKAETLKPSA